MDDKMNRQLTSSIAPGDNPKVLAQELVHYGFINEVGRNFIDLIFVSKVYYILADV